MDDCDVQDVQGSAKPFCFLASLIFYIITDVLREEVSVRTSEFCEAVGINQSTLYKHVETIRKKVSTVSVQAKEKLANRPKPLCFICCDVEKDLGIKKRRRLM
jgi:hypothetical protein